MNERIEKLAEQCRIETYGVNGELLTFGFDEEKFAELVAAQEREACAKVCDDLLAPDIYTDTDKSMWDVTCTDCAAAIRARGNT